MFKLLAVAAFAVFANAWGESDKKAHVFENVAPVVKTVEPVKTTPPKERAEFIRPDAAAVPNCPKGKRVSKGKTGNARALMIICGGWCIGRSPGAKEWIEEDLPKYDEQ